MKKLQKIARTNRSIQPVGPSVTNASLASTEWSIRAIVGSLMIVENDTRTAMNSPPRKLPR